MSKLYFKVASDWQEVVRLRDEISKLETQIKSMDANKAPQAVAVLNHQMRQTKQQMQGMISEAAKAGAAMENNFKSKIYQSSQSVNDFTQKIINQKAVVKDVEADVKRLGESYRSALKNNPLSASGKLSEYTSAKKALDEEKAALFGLTQEQANARLSVKKLRDEYLLYKDEGKGVVSTTDGIGISLKKAFAVIGGVAVIKQLGSEIIRVRGEFQSMQTAIETLVGKDMASNLIPQIKELAKTSPLTLTDMVSAEKMMLGFNINAEDTIRYLQALGDISMGNSQKFNSLTLAFSQMSATGKLMGQDLNQMINAGFNPLQQIALSTGKSISTLKEEMSKGAISAEMVQKAFIDATSAGGKFFGMSENASKTINGQLSMMQDALDEVFNELGTKGEGVIMAGIQASTSLIQNYETVGKILSGLVVTYGAYRTAVMLSTIATGKHAIAEMALTNVRVIARRAQTALNASMLTNPYVLLATVVVGAAAAMWAFHDGTTAAEKAQDSYNKKVEDATQKAQDHKQKLEDLIRELQNEVTAETRKMEILDEIKEGYPSLFQKFIDEKGHIKDLTEGWKAYNEEASKNKAIQNKNNVSGTKKNLQEYRKMVSLWDKYGEDPNFHKNELSVEEATLASKYSNETLGRLKNKIEAGERELSLYEKDVREDNFNQWKVDLKSKTDAQIEASRAALVKRAQSANGDKHLLDALGKRIIAIDEEKNVRKANAVTYGSDFDKAKTEWEAAKKELDAIEKDKDKYTRTQYDNAKKREETAEKAYKDLGGSTNTTKQESAAEKLRKEQEKYNLLLDKQKRKAARMKTDSQHEIEQIEIDGLVEGSEKVLRQRALNHDKEIETIKREAEDKKLKAIEEARSAFEANPDNKKGTFDADKFVQSESTKNLFASFDKTAEAKTKTENTKYNRGDDLKGLLDEYQDYTDKRFTIETKYNNDLETLEDQRKIAIENGDDKQVEQIDRAKAQATKKKGMELMGLDYEQLKESPEYVRAFENLKEISSETLNSLLSQLEKAKGTAAKVLSPDQLREYTTTIQEIMNELDERNPWQALSDKKQELADAEQELAQAQIELENARQTVEAVKGGAKIESGVSSSKYNPKTGKIDSSKAYLTEAQALDKVKAKTDNYNKSKDKVAEKSAKVKKSEKDVTDQIDELSKAISDVGNSIGGPAGEIISLIGDIGSFTMFAMEGIKAAADTSANAISQVEKASVILAIISAAMQIAMKIASLFKGEDEEEQRKKYIEQLNGVVDIYDKIIEKQKESIKFGYGFSAIESAKKAMEELNKQTEVYRKIAYEAGIGQMSFSQLSTWTTAAKEMGIEIPEEELFTLRTMSKLTGEQLSIIRDKYKDFWASLPEEQRNAFQAIIDAGEKGKDIINEWQEAITGISYDSFYDEFIDTLSDMDSSAADMAENFGEYLRKSILAAMVAKNFQKDISNLYEMWVAAAGDKSDGGMDITKDESNSIQQKYKELVEAMTAARDNMANDFGWTSDSSSSQDSTNGGFETMSQDEGKELNGRFTAFQISNEEIKNQSTLQSQSLNLLTMKADAILSVNTDVRNIADETRTIMANSYLELQEIRENTGAIIKPIKDMAKDIAEVKKNTSKL